MRTILTHFYNEAYLLPWWLRHHLALFDHGVLIDHGSTDGSAEICRALAPHWRLVQTSLSDFDAYLTDFEVMKYEEGLEGFKIALTTTEFLIATTPLTELEQAMRDDGRAAVKLRAAIMVDTAPDETPAPEVSLVQQKHHGYWEADHPGLGPPGTTNYARIYHRGQIGQYHPGRHGSYLFGADTIAADHFVFKYTYSPWTAPMQLRKFQISAKVSAADRQRGWGWQHHLEVNQLEAMRAERLPLAEDLSQSPNLARALTR